jgi:hypothetical protein
MTSTNKINTSSESEPVIPPCSQARDIPARFDYYTEGVKYINPLDLVRWCRAY